MLLPGLVSISFRHSSVPEIIAAAEGAGLSLIEWGGDVHLPPSDTEARARVLALSRAAGISTPTFGSYLKLGTASVSDFPDILSTAEAISVKTVRIWGGTRAVTPEDTEEWRGLVREARELAEAAEARGITLALECHQGTVTQSADTALRFLSDVASPALKAYWQPNQRLSPTENLRAARLLAPHTVCIHAFNWDRLGRYPIAEAAEIWHRYLAEFLTAAEGRDIPVLLEFMPDGKIESLCGEAAALKEILKNLKI